MSLLRRIEKGGGDGDSGGGDDKRRPPSGGDTSGEKQRPTRQRPVKAGGPSKSDG
jgi:hypothetical protein